MKTQNRFVVGSLVTASMVAFCGVAASAEKATTAEKGAIAEKANLAPNQRVTIAPGVNAVKQGVPQKQVAQGKQAIAKTSTVQSLILLDGTNATIYIEPQDL